VYQNLPVNPLVGAAVAWKASRIADPVARLRFLRRSIGDRRPVDGLPARNWKKLIVFGCFLALLPAGTLWRRAATPVVAAREVSHGEQDSVWLVEQKNEYETYSNGLRIERRYETAFEPRSYLAYARGAEDNIVLTERRNTPVGIVYHTTESAQAPFTEEHARRLTLLGAALLQYVEENKSYHYVVDRYGRVFRVVRESDAANHAGYSVWADDRHTWINLNHSFLGISVEAQSQSENDQPVVTAGQVHALRVLTEMLRARYRIAPANCVTHAQVSVNPSNMRVGYHIDWGANFPFAEIGLPDNYRTPMPSVTLFGFGFDSSLENLTGQPYWLGLQRGEELARREAAARGLSPERHRKVLVDRYKRLLEHIKTARTITLKEKEG
jgi:hypothetical protein